MNTIASAFQLEVPPHNKRQVTLLLLLRTAILLTLIFCVKHVANLEFSLLAASVFTWAGVLGGTRLAFLRLRFRGLLILATMLVLFVWLAFNALYLLPLGSQLLFFLYDWHEWSQIIILITFLGLFSTWAFWKFKVVTAIELLLLATCLLTLFAGHRHFRFDSSKLLNQIAWVLQWHPLTTLVLVGLAFGIFSSIYLFLANLALKSAPNSTIQNTARADLHSRENLLWSMASGVILAALFALVAWIIYKQQAIEVQSRLQMGVGDEASEGLSPLTFQSALGASSQPAAVVRLENDYPTNPFSPMLYLRESALSKFNGQEMVLADQEYDRDTPNVLPGEKYSFAGFPEHVDRMPITQSIYLLADHKRSFAIDYPLSFVGLTLPNNTKKFKRAFRAYSMAPTFQLKDIENLELGDPAWSSAEWEHFTTPHPDPRYHQLAQSIIQPSTNPILQARQLIAYLNSNAIYTLTPGHTVPKGEDQTAPFLFGDLRGYCVHFAHAMVYMLRSLSIPARIGTGYLTDLSQSKDGHILLRMSDRHAWAEIFITGKGWLPFDIEPQQVEVHAESPVDADLLDELMDLLGSSEEIIAPDILKDEKIDQPHYLTELAQAKYLYWLTAFVLLALYGRKSYLAFGYLLPGSSRQVGRRALVALNSRLADWGIFRGSAETLAEYFSRLNQQSMLQKSKLLPTLLQLKYSTVSTDIGAENIRADTTRSLTHLRALPLWRRVVLFINPLTIWKNY